MNQPAYPKRLIEVDLPIKRISAHARREKSIRHGHISTLHIWWARRPLAACRAVLCAALWPDPADPHCPERFKDAAKDTLRRWANESALLASEDSFSRLVSVQKNPEVLDDLFQLRNVLLDFIADFANWDNSNRQEYLEICRQLTQAANEALGAPIGTKPLVVDPFAGGGSIPLEALRVGANAFASDLNPVPVLLNKVLLEYVPKFGQRLVNAIDHWGRWLVDRAEAQIGTSYPTDPDGSKPIAYLWARTIQCEGPGCGAEIPLFRNPCIAQRGRDSVFLKLEKSEENKKVEIDVVSGGNPDPTSGAILRRSSATCPICGYTTPAQQVRDQFSGRRGGADDARLLAVVVCDSETGARRYRKAEPRDMESFNAAKKALKEIKVSNPEDVPDETLPYLRSIFNIHLLDTTEWAHLFNARQMVSLVQLTRLVRQLPGKMRSSRLDEDLVVAVTTCLAFCVDKVAAQFSSLSRWQPKGEFVVGTFGRQALGIIWISPKYGRSTAHPAI